MARGSVVRGEEFFGSMLIFHICVSFCHIALLLLSCFGSIYVALNYVARQIWRYLGFLSCCSGERANDTKRYEVRLRRECRIWFWPIPTDRAHRFREKGTIADVSSVALKSWRGVYSMLAITVTYGTKVNKMQARCTCKFLSIFDSLELKHCRSNLELDEQTQAVVVRSGSRTVHRYRKSQPRRLCVADIQSERGA